MLITQAGSVKKSLLFGKWAKPTRRRQSYLRSVSTKMFSSGREFQSPRSVIMAYYSLGFRINECYKAVFFFFFTLSF